MTRESFLENWGIQFLKWQLGAKSEVKSWQIYRCVWFPSSILFFFKNVHIICFIKKLRVIHTQHHIMARCH